VRAPRQKCEGDGGREGGEEASSGDGHC
jgi:hypothetical protein